MASTHSLELVTPIMVEIVKPATSQGKRRCVERRIWEAAACKASGRDREAGRGLWRRSDAPGAARRNANNCSIAGRLDLQRHD